MSGAGRAPAVSNGWRRIARCLGDAPLPLLFAQLLLNSGNEISRRHAERLSEPKDCAKGWTLLGPFQSGNVAPFGPGIEGEPFLRQALS
jgi:hypothetical protein